MADLMCDRDQAALGTFDAKGERHEVLSRHQTGIDGRIQLVDRLFDRCDRGFELGTIEKQAIQGLLAEGRRGRSGFGCHGRYPSLFSNMFTFETRRWPQVAFGHANQATDMSDR